MRGVRSFFSILSPLIVMAVISSIGLHSLQISHDHPTGGAHYERQPHKAGSDAIPILGEYLHMAEKKLFLAIVAPTLLSVFLAVILYGRWYTLIFYVAHRSWRFFKQYRARPQHLFDHLVCCFRCGILHPKLH